MGLRSTPAEERGSPPPRSLLFFTPHEARTVEALMGRIMPDDELGPGAVEAGTVSYADQTLAGVEQDNQRIYRSGVQLLDAACRTRFGRPFVDCTPEDQDAIVADMAAGSLAAASSPAGDPGWSLAFFELLREHTLEGMFADPVARWQSRPRRLEAPRLSRPAAGLQPRGAAARCRDRAASGSTPPPTIRCARKANRHERDRGPSGCRASSASDLPVPRPRTR